MSALHRGAKRGGGASTGRGSGQQEQTRGFEDHDIKMNAHKMHEEPANRTTSYEEEDGLDALGNLMARGNGDTVFKTTGERASLRSTGQVMQMISEAYLTRK